MASNFSKLPIFRAVSTRGYTQIAPINGIPHYDIKSCVLPNKLVVASAENEAPISRISIVFRAGSRNETPDDLGVTHVLRNSAGLTTKHASQFAIIRNIQQVGANLTATSDRETISYTLEGTRQAVEKALPFLTEVATQQVFRPWELAENTHRLHLDLATRPLQVRAIDLVHNAAFRSTGLGNSLFVPKSQIGKISSETLQHYVANCFLTGRTAVVGLGVKQSELTQFAQQLKLDSGEGCVPASPYKGGEIRSNKGGDLAFIAVAGEGACIKNTKEALAFAVLQRAIGIGPQVKWSARDNGLFTKSVPCPADYSSSAFNISYSDTGLFGLLIAVKARDAHQLVESAIRFLRSADVTEADVTRGKNQLKSSLLLDAESGSKAIQSIANQAVNLGCVQTPCDLATAVDSITQSDVKNALRKVGRKLTLASVGSLANVPFLDEVK